MSGYYMRFDEEHSVIGVYVDRRNTTTPGMTITKEGSRLMPKFLVNGKYLLLKDAPSGVQPLWNVFERYKDWFTEYLDLREKYAKKFNLYKKYRSGVL